MTKRMDLEPRQALIEAAADRLPPGLDLEFRRMFGGIGVFTRGRMCALVSSTGEIALKLDEDARHEMLQIPGAHPWEISVQYCVLPEPLLAAEPLSGWLARSTAYAQTLPLPKKRRPR